MSPLEASQADSVDEVGSTLNQLIQTCKDGEAGFQAAAAGVDDPNLQHLLESYSQQRSEFAAELELEVGATGPGPRQRGPCGGGPGTGAGWISRRSRPVGTRERS